MVLSFISKFKLLEPYIHGTLREISLLYSATIHILCHLCKGS